MRTLVGYLLPEIYILRCFFAFLSFYNIGRGVRWVMRHEIDWEQRSVAVFNAERRLSEVELSPIAEVLARRFVQRWDMYPKQLDNGRYMSVHEPLHVGLLFEHLRGEITLGTYLLDAKSRGRFIVFDADHAPGWRRLQALANALVEQGTIAYLEPSRRGGHLWLFFDKPIPGEDVRSFGTGLLRYFKIDGIELYPKQGVITTGPGSLIRLPFGVHQKSGRRYGFYYPDGMLIAPAVRQQIHVLSSPQVVPGEVLEFFMRYVPPVDTSTLQNANDAPRAVKQVQDTKSPVSERIKAAISVREFVLRYVELSPSGLGLCPFHDDHNPSFSVNDKENYWHCFAGCGGGSVIDFYMMYQRQVEKRNCDFKTAIAELAHILFL